MVRGCLSGMRRCPLVRRGRCRNFRDLEVVGAGLPQSVKVAKLVWRRDMASTCAERQPDNPSVSKRRGAVGEGEC